MKSDLIQEFIEVHGAPLGYGREQFHKLGRRVARQIAQDLGLRKGSFEISTANTNCGDANQGEVTLHTDRMYLHFSRNLITASGFLYRGCNGRKDFVGQGNRWTPYSDLLNDYERVIACFRALHDAVESNARRPSASCAV